MSCNNFVFKVEHGLRKGSRSLNIEGFKFERGFTAVGRLGLRGWGVADGAVRYPDCQSVVVTVFPAWCDAKPAGCRCGRGVGGDAGG